MPRPDPTGCLGIVSLVGGSGKSSLAANLASLFCRSGEEVLLVGTSEFSSLPFQFGARKCRPGERTFIAPSPRRSRLRLVLPETLTAAWLENVVSTRPMSRTVLDLGPMPKDLLRLALTKCSAVLVPLLPDLNWIWSLSPLQGLFAECPGASERAVLYVINQYEETPQSRGLVDEIRTRLGENLLPFQIPRNSEHDAALRAGLVLADYAPRSLASEAYGRIALWLRSVQPVHASFEATTGWTEL
jgi:cellulose biosynthesis protein BcsQ